MNGRVRRTAVALLALLATWPAAGGARGADELSLTGLIEKVEPAVVRIDIFTADGKAIGSGLVVDRQGIIATNFHVMAGATEGKVTFENKKEAKIEGTLYLDAKRDIAIVKIDGGSYPALQLATELPRKGTSVAAFGSPQGLSFTTSEGIISAVREAKELEGYGEDAEGTWLQTTAPISPGNSGGPLVDYQGRVVGANTMTLVRSQNLNFAISSLDIAEALEKSRGESVVALEDGAAKKSIADSFSSLTGERRLEAISFLADLMLIGDLDSRDVAVAAKLLLLVDPKSVDDKDVYSKVARGFKRLAFDKHSHYREDSIRGMVRWGGKHSIPYLIELLDMEELRADEVLIDALSDCDDPRASAAIARQFADFFNRQRAIAALRRMGPAAEPGLIEAVRSPNPVICRTAIALLAEQGTPAALPVLQEAVRRGAYPVRLDAKEAQVRIRARKEQAEQSAGGGE